MTSQTAGKYVLSSVDRDVLTLTLHRPDARNAMNLEMVQEVTAAIRAADASASLRALVLQGTAGHFCSGGDIKDFARARSSSGDPSGVIAVNAAFGHMCLAFARTTLPTICALEGAVLGGGFGLACASDLTLATRSARFGLPETSLGLVPAQIAPFLVERLGLAQAKRLALSGMRIDAETAQRLGLIHELCDDAAALQAALTTTVARVLSGAPQATRVTKGLLLRARNGATEAVIHDAAKAFAAALNGPEGGEGTAAFVQKRRPAWDPARN